MRGSLSRPEKISMPKTAAAKARRRQRRQQKKIMKTKGQAPVVYVEDPIATQRRAVTKVQNLLRSRVKSANSGVHDLALSMVLPADMTLRYPTEDMPRSSLANLTDQRNVSSPSTAFSSFPTGDILAAYFGQPGRLAMIYGPLATGNGTGYFTNETATSLKPTSTKQIIVPPSPTTVTSIGVYLDPIGFAALTTPVHGQTQTVGRQDNHTFVWMNPGDTMTIDYSLSFGGTYTGTFNFKVIRYQGPNSPPEDVNEITATITGGLGQVAYGNGYGAGYYAFCLDSLSLSSGTSILQGIYNFRMEIGWVATSGWMQVSMADCDPNASGDLNMLEEARVNSASLLVTNVSSALNRQGTVLAARMRQVPFWKVTPSLLGRAAEKYQGDACHGCYTFFEFSDTRQRFANCNSDYAPAFDLDYNDYYHFIELSNPAYATAPNSYAFKFDTALEFKTDIGRYSKATSEHTYAELIAARKLINSVPIWFYENPTHAQQLYGLIKRALKGAWQLGKRAAPYALNAASAANPELAPLFQALKLAL